MAKKSSDLSRIAGRESYRHIRLADDRLRKALVILEEVGANGILYEEILQLRGSVAAALLITGRARGTAADIAHWDNW